MSEEQMREFVKSVFSVWRTCVGGCMSDVEPTREELIELIGSLEPRFYEVMTLEMIQDFLEEADSPEAVILAMRERKKLQGSNH